jgi:hypothetical protein
MPMLSSVDELTELVDRIFIRHGVWPDNADRITLGGVPPSIRALATALGADLAVSMAKAKWPLCVA